MKMQPTAPWRRTVPEGCTSAQLATKYTLIASACSRVPGATAPAVLDDHDDFELALEFLDLGQPFGRHLRTAMMRGERAAATQAVELAARTLAAVHALPLPDGATALVDLVRQPLPVRSATGDVLLHGDFGFSNLSLRTGGDTLELQVIDPLLPPMLPQVPLVVGPPEWDVAVMLSCLAGRPPMPLFGHRRDRAALIDAFCAEYERTTGRRLDAVGAWVLYACRIYAASRTLVAKVERWGLARILARRADRARA